MEKTLDFYLKEKKTLLELFSAKLDENQIIGLSSMYRSF